MYRKKDPLCPRNELSDDQTALFEETCFNKYGKDQMDEYESCVSTKKAVRKSSPYPNTFNNISLSVIDDATGRSNYLELSISPCKPEEEELRTMGYFKCNKNATNLGDLGITLLDSFVQQEIKYATTTAFTKNLGHLAYSVGTVP